MRIALATSRDLPDGDPDDAPLHAALRAAGCAVELVAWDAADVAWEAYDACLIRTPWDYMERREAFVAWARQVEQHTRLFNDAATVAWNTHKGYLRELERRGARVLPFELLERGSRHDPARLLQCASCEQGFLKPAVGATSRETLVFSREPEELERARAHLDRLLPEEDLLFQAFQPRVRTEGELSLVLIDGRATHGVRKRSPDGDYRVQDDFGGTAEPWEAPAQLRAACERLMADLDRPLYARADFLPAEDGELALIELELVEPSLFFSQGEHAATALAGALVARL